MRKLLVFLTALLALSLTAAAQDYKKAQIFGGYSYFRLDTQGTDSEANFHGWNAELQGNINEALGIVADFSGHYKSQDILGADVDSNVHNFLFGPRVTFRTERFSPFVHALFGVARSKASALNFDVTDTNFAMALGGGIDYDVSENFAIRLAKADYLYVRGEDDGNSDNFRFSTGVVFRF